MQTKKILLAFDSSESSYNAVAYAGDMLAHVPDVHVTLVLVERLPDRDFFPDEASWLAECASRTQAHHRNLHAARTRLTEYGIPAEAIDERYLASCKSPFGQATVCSTGESVVEDILRIQREEGYGTVIVGKRGVSKTEAFLFGSVSNRIIQETQGCTVWVVG